MIRRLTGATIALCLFALVAIAAPQIQVDSDTYDFGSILEGFAVEHTFVLTNTGDETLVIDRVRATCGCTTTALATDELRPGQSVELDAVIGTTGFGGQLISKSIYVYSNDPEYSDGFGPDRLVLTITGTVLRAEPYSITTEDLLLDSYVLVDLRPAAAFEDGHLLGAVNIEPGDLDATLGAFSLPESALLFLYDETGAGSYEIADDLFADGYILARALSGGLSAWVRGYGNRYTFPPIGNQTFDAPAPKPTDDRYVLDLSYFEYAFYLLVDLRESEAFTEGHLVGAINIPNSEFSLQTLIANAASLPTDTTIVLYDATSATSDRRAQELNGYGYANAKSLLGGFDYWQEAYGDQLVWTEGP